MRKHPQIAAKSFEDFEDFRIARQFAPSDKPGWPRIIRKMSKTTKTYAPLFSQGGGLQPP